MRKDAQPPTGGILRAIADYHQATLTLSDNAPGLRVEIVFSH